MKVTIHVSQEDIDKAESMRLDQSARRSENCPVAQAMRHLWPNAWVGHISCSSGEEDPNSEFGGDYEFDLPYEAKRAVWLFDHHEEVEPFSFIIEVP